MTIPLPATRCRWGVGSWWVALFVEAVVTAGAVTYEAGDQGLRIRD
jgi:hypothetical protein